MWSDPILHQYLQAPIVVQSVVNLPQVEEDRLEDLLTYCCNILNQIRFEGGVPHYFALPKSVEDVVVRYCQSDPSVDQPRHCLPQDLHEANCAEVLVPLGQ